METKTIAPEQNLEKRIEELTRLVEETTEMLKGYLKENKNVENV